MYYNLQLGVNWTMQGQADQKVTPIPTKQPLHSFSVMQNLIDNNFIVQQYLNLCSDSNDHNNQIPFANQVYFDKSQEKNARLQSASIANQPNIVKERKKRVQINKDIRQKMIKAFRQFQHKEQFPFAKKKTLTQIAVELNVSQTTIFRKYRQFKQNNSIAESARNLASQSRSYKKTKILHSIIDQCIKRQHFKNAPQLASYIAQNYGKIYSRFQILQYFKKINYNTLANETNQALIKEKTDQIKVYRIFKTYIQNQNSLLFYAQQDCITSEGFKATICLLCGLKGMFYHLAPRQLNSPYMILKPIIGYLLSSYFRQYGQDERWVLALDHKIFYRCKEGERNVDAQRSTMREIMMKNGKMIKLPESPDQLLNLGNEIIRKANINGDGRQLSFAAISQKLKELQNTFTQSSFYEFSANWYVQQKKNLPEIEQEPSQA